MLRLSNDNVAYICLESHLKEIVGKAASEDAGAIVKKDDEILGDYCLSC
jgi:hypothetical protein